MNDEEINDNNNKINIIKKKNRIGCIGAGYVGF
jgi:hypothetical protein